MKKIIESLLLVLVVAGSSRAQALSTGKAPAMTWMLDAEAGSGPGVGVTMPHLAFGTSFERPIGTRVELRGGASFAPDWKYITNDGSTLNLKSEGLLWVTRRLAVTGGLEISNLWASQSKERVWAPTAGIGIRDHSFGIPGRLYLAYLFPTGCQWGANCPIQSSRLLGGQVYLEKRVLTHLRLGYQFGFYRILNQGNPLDPAAGRTGEITGDMHVVIRFEFPGGSVNREY